MAISSPWRPVLALALLAVPAPGQVPCDPLPAPVPPITTVASGDVDGLLAAVDAAQTGETILLEDGLYDLRQRLVFDTPGVTLRSASGNREAVVLDGGWTAQSGYLTDFLVQVTASDVLIADLTLRNAFFHPIQIYGPGTPISGVHLRNLVVIDPGQQAIKINPSSGGFVDDGVIECSHLELTALGRAEVRDNCYTGGIDAHAAWGWQVRNNRIEGFWCESGLSEHAIHFWQASRDTVIEGNVILDCARGIGLGLGETGNDRSYADDPYPGVGYLGHIDGVVRNNFVAAAQPELFASASGFDTGIACEAVRGAELVHNTVASTTPPRASSMEWRFAVTDVHLANNLLTDRAWERQGATATVEATLEFAPLTWFEGVAAADLHLTLAALPPRDAGVDLGSLAPTDIDGQPRTAPSDIGADETGIVFADGFESGDTGAWSSSGP